MADLSFSIASETTAFDNGIRRGVIAPLEDADKALEELGRTGDRELAEVEDAMEDARRDTEKFEESIKDVSDALTRVGRKGRDTGADLDDGFDKAKQGAADFRDEANSTAREAAASFDGSAESIGGAFQEVAANAFAGFGPAGAAAGLAAAAGIGLTMAAFEASNEASEKAKEKAAEWADAYIEAGTRILSASQVIEGVQAIVTDPEQYQEAKDNAREWGVETSIALLAMAGDANALAEAQSSLKERVAEYKQAQTDSNGATLEAQGELQKLRNDLTNGEQAMKDLTDSQAIGAQSADAYSESLRLLAENTAGTTAKVDEFGDTVYTLPDGKQVYIDAETGKATENVDAIERRIYGMPTERQIEIQVLADMSPIERQIAVLSQRTITLQVRGGGMTDDQRWIE